MLERSGFVFYHAYDLAFVDDGAVAHGDGGDAEDAALLLHRAAVGQQTESRPFQLQEIEGDELKEGMQVVTGEQPKGAPGESTPASPFTPQLFRR